MTFDAARLTEYQTCRRRALLNADWRVLRWRPRTLFLACLRHAILKLSAALGKAPLAASAEASVARVCADAKAEFLQAAANPGLEMPKGSDPWTAAKDWCAMLDTIPRALALRQGIPALLGDLPPVILAPGLTWTVLSSAINGELHRWIALDNWTEEDLSRELHSWHTVGDQAATLLPLTLHVIEIGRLQQQRRASPWARAWRHPAMPSLRLRFRKSDGKDFEGYKPVYLADYTATSPAAWLEQMERDHAITPLLHEVRVAAPPLPTAAATLAQMRDEGLAWQRLLADREAHPWPSLPMSRAACDGFVPCPWQEACHSHTPSSALLPSLGLYQRRT